MLRELVIENFALIDRLRLEFEEGFNILTGETGAGKSIIIDAVSLILGGRSSSEQVRAGKESAQIEGVFELDDNQELFQILAEWGIPLAEDRLLVINREVNQSGRSRARINGQTVTVLTLRRVGEFIMDIHGQHEHQSLLSSIKQREILDSFGGEPIKNKLEEVSNLYYQWQEIKKELGTLTTNEQEKNQRLEFLAFQLQEIERANLKPEEEAALDKERQVLAGAERLYEAASATYQLLYGGEEPGSALDKLGEGVQELEKAVEIDLGLEKWVELLKQAAYQLEEVSREIRSYRDQIEFNPEELSQIEERLDEISKLKRKYGKSIPQILEYSERIRKELTSIEDRSERIETLSKELKEKEKRLAVAVQELSALRKETAERLETAVSKELAEVNMAKTVFKITLKRNFDEQDGLLVGKEKVAVGKYGIDQVDFMVAPNPGEGLRLMTKIASGGELSRLMLVLKVIMAEEDQIPTMVFDEIDVGIGGRTAQAVAEKLLILGLSHQVICVTHLPQIASMANRHFYIEKKAIGERTMVEVRTLGNNDRVEELARMLGGAEVTSTTREHAREMLLLADSVRINKAGQG
jgi:DNA repair protein RecN (Recombination protein N)